jgi:hypothetical protein
VSSDGFELVVLNRSQYQFFDAGGFHAAILSSKASDTSELNFLPGANMRPDLERLRNTDVIGAIRDIVER